MTKSWGVGRPVSAHINKRTTQSMFRSFDFAKASGQGFSHYVVINLREGGLNDPAISAQKIIHKFRDWLSHRRNTTGLPYRPVYVGTLESPHGHTHMNWVLSLPPELEAEFTKKLPRWVERVQGTVGDFDIYVGPVVTGYEKRLAKYVLKGTDPRCVSHFYLEDVHEPQGAIVGRRTLTSRTLGAAARKRVGFHPGHRRPYIPPEAAASPPPSQPSRASARLP
jgi:hypothetical protein